MNVAAVSTKCLCISPFLIRNPSDSIMVLASIFMASHFQFHVNYSSRVFSMGVQTDSEIQVELVEAIKNHSIRSTPVAA